MVSSIHSYSQRQKKTRPQEISNCTKAKEKPQRKQSSWSDNDWTCEIWNVIWTAKTLGTKIF